MLEPRYAAKRGQLIAADPGLSSGPVERACPRIAFLYIAPQFGPWGLVYQPIAAFAEPRDTCPALRAFLCPPEPIRGACRRNAELRAYLHRAPGPVAAAGADPGRDLCRADHGAGRRGGQVRVLGPSEPGLSDPKEPQGPLPPPQSQGGRGRRRRAGAPGAAERRR